MQKPELFLWNADQSLQRFIDEFDRTTLNEKMAFVDTKIINTVKIAKKIESLLLVSLLMQISEELERAILSGKKVKTLFLADMRKTIRVMK